MPNASRSGGGAVRSPQMATATPSRRRDGATNRRHRGWLKHGNPPGDLSQVATCGARSKRGGQPCRAPAMRNGRCRLHGGLSTGPRTPEGLARSRRARWKHGGYSVEERQRYLELSAACRAHAVTAAARVDKALADGRHAVQALKTDLRNRQRRRGSRTGGPQVETTPTARQILHEIARLAFSTVPAPRDERGHLQTIGRLAADAGAGCCSIKIVRRRCYAPATATAHANIDADIKRAHVSRGVDLVCKVQCRGRLKALKMLALRAGLLQQRAEMETTEQLLQVLRQGRVRNAEAARRRRAEGEVARADATPRP